MCDTPTDAHIFQMLNNVSTGYDTGPGNLRSSVSFFVQLFPRLSQTLLMVVQIFVSCSDIFSMKQVSFFLFFLQSRLEMEMTKSNFSLIKCISLLI